MITTVRLPKPPSTNALFVNVPGKGRVKSAAYKRWIREAGWMLLAQRVKPIAGRVRIKIEMVRGSNRKMDIDNRIKPVLDALVRYAIIKDDRDVETVTASWVQGDFTDIAVKIETMEYQDVAS